MELILRMCQNVRIYELRNILQITIFKAYLKFRENTEIKIGIDQCNFRMFVKYIYILKTRINYKFLVKQKI